MALVSVVSGLVIISKLDTHVPPPLHLSDVNIYGAGFNRPGGAEGNSSVSGETVVLFGNDGTVFGVVFYVLHSSRSTSTDRHLFQHAKLSGTTRLLRSLHATLPRSVRYLSCIHSILPQVYKSMLLSLFSWWIRPDSYD